MNRTQKARKGRSQPSKTTGSTKSATQDQIASTCPALAMARLMGTYFRASLKYGELETEARKAGDEASEDTFGKGWSASHGVSEVARIALAMSHARSIEGAIAKIVMSWEVDDDINSSKHDEASAANLRMVRDLLREDAMNYFIDAHGVDLEKIGVSYYYTGSSMPFARINEARKLAQAKAAA